MLVSYSSILEFQSMKLNSLTILLPVIRTVVHIWKSQKDYGAVHTKHASLHYSIRVSQGSVATRLRCGVIFNDSFIANCSQSMQWNNYENRSIFGKDMDKRLVTPLTRFYGSRCRCAVANSLSLRVRAIQDKKSELMLMGRATASV